MCHGGDIEETVFWVVASGLGVSEGEAIGTEQTWGYTICSEDAPSSRKDDRRGPRSRAEGFIRRKPRPPPSQEV